MSKSFRSSGCWMQLASTGKVPVGAEGAGIPRWGSIRGVLRRGRVAAGLLDGEAARSAGLAADGERLADIAAHLDVDEGQLVAANKARLRGLRRDSELGRGTVLRVPRAGREEPADDSGSGCGEPAARKKKLKQQRGGGCNGSRCNGSQQQRGGGAA